MAVTIDQVTALQFSATLLTLSQQKESKFASRVRQERVSSAEHAYFDTIDAYDAPSQKADRHGDTPLSEATFARRKVTPWTWEAGTLLDKYDMDRMLADPQGPVVQAHAMSLGRKKDDLIIAAMVGDATIGKNGGSTMPFEDESVSISGDAAGIKTVLGTAAVIGTIADIDLAKILMMTEIFNEQDVDPSIPKHWAVSPKDIADMLAIEQIGSADYNTVKAIQQGGVDTYAGFGFFWTNRLLQDSTGVAYRTLAWAQDGVILATIGDINTAITPRPDKRNYTQVYSNMDLGAVRMEGAKVHECLTKIAV